MKLQVLIAAAVLSLVACERHDGKVIIDEKKTEEKAKEVVDKTTEEAQKLGKDIKDGAKDLGQKVDQKAKEHELDPGTGPGTDTDKAKIKGGKGGGPRVCDGGLKCD